MPSKPIFHIKTVSPVVEPYKFLSKSSLNSYSTYVPRSSKPKQAKEWSLKSFKIWFLENLRNYCNTTSLHGFNYITNMNFTMAERYFWIFIVIIAIIVSMVLVAVSYLWNRAMPTVTVIESSHYATWNIPFPAVTLCNFNKISRVKALNLVKKLNRPTGVSEDEVLKIFRITMFFNYGLNQSDINYNLATQLLQMNNLTLYTLSQALVPNCMRMISNCVWKGTRTRCDSLFQRVVTIEGECCSFNYYGMEKNNFPEKIAYQVARRPYRVTGCGFASGLSILLNPLAQDYFATYYSSYGFRLLLHDSYDFPDENAESKIITSTLESFVRINPESTYATDDVKGMNIDMRNCIFPREERLATMQRYSFINCMSECRIKYMYEKCGCVTDNLPSRGNSSYSRCGVEKLKCVLENRNIFTRALNTLNRSLTTVQTTTAFPCNCRPDCESNHYNSEITMGKINSRLELSQDNDEINPNDKMNILLHVFFSDLISTRYRTEIYQNWLSTLASFGGLLGLIMGFSIVTAFEFVYFLTFRPVFNYFNHNNT